MNGPFGEKPLNQGIGPIGYQLNPGQDQASHHGEMNLTDARPSDERAPINLVDGSPWSPGVYRALRFLGRSLETAWEKAFIRSSHF